MASKKTTKLNWRLILSIAAAAVLIWLVLSGRLQLFGGGNDPAVTVPATTESDIPIVTGEAFPTAATTAQPATTTAQPATTAPPATKATTATEATVPLETTETLIPIVTEPPATPAPSTEPPAETHVPVREYHFRNKALLNDHYDKHGKEMGFKSAKEYEAAASAVINNPACLYKTEKEDGDHVFFLEETGDFVVLSLDGYIRTYFRPSSGKKYFDRQ